MFKRTAKLSQSENTLSSLSQVINTMLGQGSVIRGDLCIQGFLRVDGDLQGNVKCNERVVLGDQARVKGDIVAEEVVVAGALVGNIIAHSKVKILSSALVLGNITSSRLLVEKGAVLCGLCCIQEVIEEISTSANGEALVREPLGSPCWEKKSIDKDMNLSAKQRHFSE